MLHTGGASWGVQKPCYRRAQNLRHGDRLDAVGFVAGHHTAAAVVVVVAVLERLAGGEILAAVVAWIPNLALPLAGADSGHH